MAAVQATISPIHPALPPRVHLALTVVYTVLYSGLFLVVYVQLWMIWYYRHRRFSYQTVFLFLCLLWSGLRTTLFSFYFMNCVLANNLPVVAYWLLYCFPVCLQFIMLCLLTLFFAQVVFKAMGRYEPYQYKIPLCLAFAAAIGVFLVTNITCAVIAKIHDQNSSSTPFIVVLVRVVVNDVLFLICGILLSLFIYKVTKLTSASLALEAQGTTVCQALCASVLIVILFTSRALYNIIAVSNRNILNFGFNWINVSDQADFGDLNKGFAYLTFGCVLFLWEFLPTMIVVIFFKVRRPRNSSEFAALTSPGYNQRAYFFDNPRRYDSEDDLERSYSSKGSMPEASSPFYSAGFSPENFQGATPSMYADPVTPHGNIQQAPFYDGT